MKHEKEKAHAQALLHTSHRGVDDTRTTGRGGADLQGIQTKPDYSQRFPCITSCFRCRSDYRSSDTMRDAVAMPRARTEMTTAQTSSCKRLRSIIKCSSARLSALSFSALASRSAFRIASTFLRIASSWFILSIPFDMKYQIITHKSEERNKKEKSPTQRQLSEGHASRRYDF